ncbi:hypothetical protein [Arthrobacter methylotrophus]|uniref:hypothetical protein n=1 Tax=Arthrobacter methylotrophus TaxID=121291 RepID=UPI0031E5BB13
MAMLQDWARGRAASMLSSTTSRNATGRQHDVGRHADDAASPRDSDRGIDSAQWCPAGGGLGHPEGIAT